MRIHALKLSIEGYPSLVFFQKMKKLAKTYSNKNLQKFEKNCFFSTSNLKDLDQKSEAKLKSEAKPNFYPPPFAWHL